MHGPLSSIIEMKNDLGYGYTEQLFIFDKEYLDYHYLEDDFINAGNEFYNKWNEDNSYFNYCINKYNDLNGISMALLEQIKKIDFKKLKDDELFDLFNKVSFAYTKPIGVGHILEAISYVIEPIIKEKLSNETKLDFSDKKFKEIFSILLQPSKASWVTEESLDLLYITKEIIDNDLKNLFSEDIKIIWNKLPNNIKEKIISHRKKYYYNQLNYIHAEGLNDLDYLKEIKEFILDNIYVDSRINEHLTRYSNNNKNRLEIIKKYNLSDELVKLIN